jgi:hypothetical protein
MDIGTIIAGLNALSNLFGGNEPIPMTPAQGEEKPKKAQQTPINSIFILPNQMPPMGFGVPPVLPLAGMLANQLPQQQPAIHFPMLADLYRLYYGTR